LKKHISLILLSILIIGLYFYKKYEFTNYEEIWRNAKIEGKLNKKIFLNALNGKKKFCKYTNILTIIDYSKPSTSKRFFVIDLENQKVLFQSYVAHGQNSGENYATEFSNQNESHKSSLGFYKTKNTYYGKHGYSLKLEGLEKGKNDLAEKRAIVIHGADYVSEEFIKENGRLGRSHGCPALPQELSKVIINELKDGSCLYITK